MNLNFNNLACFAKHQLHGCNIKATLSSLKTTVLRFISHPWEVCCHRWHAWWASEILVSYYVLVFLWYLIIWNYHCSKLQMGMNDIDESHLCHQFTDKIFTKTNFFYYPDEYKFEILMIIWNIIVLAEEIPVHPENEESPWCEPVAVYTCSIKKSHGWNLHIRLIHK